MTIGIFVAVGISRTFPYGTHPQGSLLVPYIGLGVVLGIGLLLSIRWIPNQTPAASTSWAMALIGLVMRGAMFFSFPVLEDDSYRYLWDGAVVSEGIDPYKYAPLDGYSDSETISQDELPEDLVKFRQLAEDNPVEHGRVAYPGIKTIYPPIAQLGFALAHQIDPFGLMGWRFTLFLCDVVSLLLLMEALNQFGRSSAWAVLYWWNPVVIIQGFGAGHMDIMIVPFLLGALVLHKQGRPTYVMVALAGAAAVKLWPILLFPVFSRKWLGSFRHVVWITIVFVGLTSVLLLPQLFSAFTVETGIYAYSTSWRRHAFVFAILENGVFGHLHSGGQMARLLVAIVVSSTALLIAYQKGATSQTVPSAIVTTIALLIFLSPTGYPWYLIWLVPFLPFAPNTGLIALTATAPFYYFRFVFGDANPIYIWGVVPIAFGIPLLIILVSGFRNWGRLALHFDFR